MKVCPKCGKVVDFNSYFGAYICDECGWEDNSYSRGGFYIIPSERVPMGIE